MKGGQRGQGNGHERVRCPNLFCHRNIPQLRVSVVNPERLPDHGLEAEERLDHYRLCDALENARDRGRILEAPEKHAQRVLLRRPHCGQNNKTAAMQHTSTVQKVARTVLGGHMKALRRLTAVCDQETVAGLSLRPLLDNRRRLGVLAQPTGAAPAQKKFVCALTRSLTCWRPLPRGSPDEVWGCVDDPNFVFGEHGIRF